MPEIHYYSTPATDIPLALLLLADPNADLIADYLPQSMAIAAYVNDVLAGAIVTQRHSDDVAEIVNLAVYPAFQRRGIARRLLKQAIDLAKAQHFQTLKIATGNSSLHQLKLYQQVGFSIEAIEKDYFTRHYPDPIIENGICCEHKIILSYDIESSL